MGVCVCTLRKCIMYLSKCCWLCYCSAGFLRCHKSHASLLSHLFIDFFCRMSSADVPDHSVFAFCVVDRSQRRCSVFLCLSGHVGLWINEAWGSSSVWVIFMHPRAETIWWAPDMDISVSNSWGSVLCLAQSCVKHSTSVIASFRSTHWWYIAILRLQKVPAATVDQ